MKNSTLFKLILNFGLSIILMVITMSSACYGQVKEVLYYCQDDITIGSGDNFKDVVMGGQLQMCNFDDNETLMSYFETWIKFNFTDIADSIPDGQAVLYAFIRFRVSANAGPQGARFYHLYDIDDWSQDALTWTDAQSLNYEEEGAYDQFAVLLPEDAGGTSARPELNVTDQVLYELGESGNKLLTIRAEPYVKEYIDNDPYYDKKWLGFYSREVSWELGPDDPFNLYCPQITLYIGPPEPKIFSDDADFGTVENFDFTPSKFGFWLVREDEGDARLLLAQRPAPINGSPGGIAVYNMETYGDFDISVKAKLNKLKGEALDPKADFVIVFGHTGPMDYTYMRFTGEDINGFYQVDTTGGGTVSEIGALKTEPAIADTNYHDYRLVRSGTTVTAYIDDAEYMTLTDAALGVEGMIGLGSYNDIALFDDFVEGAGGGPGAVNDLNQTMFNLYPNPASDQVHIEADQNIQKLVITNIIGQEILTIDNILSTSINVDISGFETGIYFITVQGSGNKPSIGKLLVK